MRTPSRLIVSFVSLIAILASIAVGPDARPAAAATLPSTPQAAALQLQAAWNAGTFTVLEYPIYTNVILPVAQNGVHNPGCAVDLRIWQLMILMLDRYGSLQVSDLQRPCIGSNENCEFSVHCTDPGKAVDFSVLGGVVLTGGDHRSIDALLYLDPIVPNGTTVGQAYCRSMSFVNFVQIDDECHHMHIDFRNTNAPLAGASAGAAGLVMPGDFSGDGKSDILFIRPNGDLALYTGNGVGGWSNAAGTVIGTGWNAFSHVFSPGDFNGDGKSDLIAVGSTGNMRLYTGNGTGGWANPAGTQIGTGFTFPTIAGPGDFDGDGKRDVVVVDSAGTMFLFRGNGTGGWVTGSGVQIGTGFVNLRTLLSPGKWDGDPYVDVIAAMANGDLRLYAGNGPQPGHWSNGNGPIFGTGFGTATRLGMTDFSGDGKADLIASWPDGTLRMYTGNGGGGWANGNGVIIGTGW